MSLLQKDIKSFLWSVRFPVFILIVLWLIHVYNLYFGGNLGYWGIYPRELDGLKGIVLAPLVHNSKDSFQHIISNSVPLIFLSSMLVIFYKRVAYPSFFIIYFLTGFTVWMFGRPVYHIGASGVVYGLLSFVFWSGIFRKNLRSIILALIVTLVFNGYFLGLIPDKEGVSWESHLFGAFAGIFTAFLFKSVLEKEELDEEPWYDESEEVKAYFFPRDTFELTKSERIYLRQMEELKKRQQAQDSEGTQQWTSDFS